MRPKHRKDYNHCKSGWVGGNVRYQRRRPTRGMGKARMSAHWREHRRRVEPEVDPD